MCRIRPLLVLFFTQQNELIRARLRILSLCLRALPKFKFQQGSLFGETVNTAYITINVIILSKTYELKPRWLAQNVRHRSLANSKVHYQCAGWQYAVSFLILNYVGWLTPVLHDGWLGVLFPKTLARWQWRAEIFFPGRVKYYRRLTQKHSISGYNIE